MSDLKFACPVCGQHLTASSADSGQEIDCPTCFQRLIVPEPRNGDSKLVVTASKAGERRRVPVAAHGAGGKPAVRGRTISISAVCLVLVLAGLLSALYTSRKHVSGPAESVAGSNEVSAAAGPAVVPEPEWPWSLEVTNAVFSNTPAQGRIRGEPFRVGTAVLQGGTLTLRQGPSGAAELAVAVYLRAAKGEDLAGKTFTVSSDRSPVPMVQLRWKDEQKKMQTERIRDGYAMKIAFDMPANGRMTGRIWLSTPDVNQSFVCGTFDAEIRKPQPRKPAKAPAPKPTPVAPNTKPVPGQPSL